MCVAFSAYYISIGGRAADHGRGRRKTIAPPPLGSIGMADACVANYFACSPPSVGGPGYSLPRSPATLKFSRGRRRPCPLVFSISGGFVANPGQQPVLLDNETDMRSSSRGGGGRRFRHCSLGRQRGMIVPIAAVAGAEHDCRAVARDCLCPVDHVLARAGAGARTGELLCLPPLLRGLRGRGNARVGGIRGRLSR